MPVADFVFTYSFVSGRQFFLYRTKEGLPVNRPEQWICRQKPRDIPLTLPKVTRDDYDPSDFRVAS